MMEWYLWVLIGVVVYWIIGMLVMGGLVAFGMELDSQQARAVVGLWWVVLFYLLMLWIAEKRGPNDPCNH